jgi:hypothetical protein
MKLQFRDAAIHISSTADGDLSIAADDEIDLTSTLIDINGNVEISGTAAITGIATFTDDIIIGDGKTIGSASDIDAITIASNGQVTLTQTLIGTALDISGNIDVNGTTNLDVVDIDGAVNMATTLLVTGETTLQTHLNMGDNDTIKLGDGGDLQIYHDGSQSYIQDTGTGSLMLSGSQVNMLNAARNAYMLQAIEGGAATIYHNNAIKFATASTGVNVTGGIGLGGTGAANILDDYEEGTFTPTLKNTGGVEVDAYSIQVGFYTKIGRLVHANIVISANGLGSTGSSNVILLGGLPFDALSSTNHDTAISVSHAVNLNITAGQNVGGFLPANSTNIRLALYDSTQGTTDFTFGELSADGQIKLSIQYNTA